MRFWDKLLGSKDSNSGKNVVHQDESIRNSGNISTASGNGKIKRMTFFFDSQYPPYSESKVIKDLIEYFKLQNKLDPSVHITTQYGHVPAVPEYYRTGSVPDELMPFIMAHASLRWGIMDEKGLGQIRTYCFRVTDIWGVLLTSEI